MEIQFVTSFAVITADPVASRALYVNALGLPLGHSDGDDYWHSEKIDGVKHFGVWPLQQAAQACFGTDQWASDYPEPQASVEFEVANTEAVAEAVAELESAGYPMLHGPRLEPWGQTVARMLSPEGLIVGISYAPAMHT